MYSKWKLAVILELDFWGSLRKYLIGPDLYLNFSQQEKYWQAPTFLLLLS